MTFHISSYIPQDRLHALAQGETLPEAASGSALFVDISGFTPLFKNLAGKLGSQRAAEEMTRLLNRVYESMISQVERQRGSVIDFVGDAITCWFEDDIPPFRAATCALAIQREMAAFAGVEVVSGVTAELTVKIGIACGPARRFAVGDPAVQQIDTLVGQTLSRMSQAEGMAEEDEILLAPAAAAALGKNAVLSETRRHPESGAEFAVLKALSTPAAVAPWPDAPVLDIDQVRPWIPAPLVDRLQRERSETLLPELRPIVALFLRFSGIDYDLDPDAGQKLDAFIRWVQQTVGYYDAHLLQLTIGDKGSFLYVTFGALVAHDDDALRAVSAAKRLLALPDELDFITPQIGIAGGQARTGVYGSSTRRSFGAIGSDVVLAARLMMSAPPGEIRCAYSIYRQAGSKETFVSLPSIRVKGRVDLIRVYRPAAGPQPAAAERETEMVGRQDEMATVERLLADVQAGAGHVLLIEGEAGIGKSRLVAQLMRVLEQHELIGLPGSGLSIEQQTPYRAWRDVLIAYFGLEESADAGERRTHLAAVVGQIIPEQVPRLPLLNDVLGLDLPENELTEALEPQLRRQNVSLLLVALLEAWARERPLILILEDAHWLDTLSWELVLDVARSLSLANAPFLLVLVHRPLAKTSQGRRVLAEVREMELAQTVRLPELAPAAITALIASRLGVTQDALPAALVDLVQTRAQGNPFFAEELLANLRDAGVIQTVENTCHVTGDLEAAGSLLPDTLHGLILSRIDRLPPARRHVLKVAAVLGRAFAFAPLFFTLNRHTETRAARLKRDLTALENADFTFLESLEPDLTYLFKHIIIQEAAYQTLLFAQRRDLHRAAAAWYESQGEARAYLPLLAYHYRYAEDVEKERQYLQLAGDAAEKTYANDAAIEFYSRLLTLTPEQERTNLHLKRGRIYELIGRWDEAEGDYRAALALSEQDTAAGATAQLAIGKLHRLRGDYPTALTWLARAEEVHEAQDNVLGLMQVLIETGIVLHNRGEYDRASVPLSAGLAIARREGDQASVVQALNYLGNGAHEQGKLSEAQTFFTESLSLAQAAGDMRGVANALQNLGLVAEVQGDEIPARALYGKSLALRREIGDIQGIANILNNLGNLFLAVSEHTAARAHYEESLALRRKMGEKKGIAYSLNNLAIVMGNLGDNVATRALYEESLALNRQMGDQWGVAMVLTNLGGVMMELDDINAARALFVEALELWQKLGVKQGVVIAGNNLGYVLTMQEELVAARARHEACRAISLEMGDKMNIAFADLGLGLVAVAEGELARGQAHMLAALRYYQDSGRQKSQLASLIALAGQALLAGRAQRAAYLLGVVDAANKALNLTTDFYVKHFHDQTIAAVRQALPEAMFRAAWQEGEQNSLEDTVSEVLNQV